MFVGLVALWALLTLFIEGYTIGDAQDHYERRILSRKGCLAGLHLTNQCSDILRFYLARTGPRLGFHCVLRNREDSHQVREVSQSASFVDPSFQSGRQSVLWERVYFLTTARTNVSDLYQ